MRTHVNITRINKIEAMYGRSRVNFKVELRSTCTFVGSFSYIAPMLFTGLKFTSRTYSRENYAVVEVDFHCVNEIEAMYESPRVNVKVERGSAFRYMLDLPYNVSILRTRKIYVFTQGKITIPDSGNPPLRSGGARSPAGILFT